MTPLPKNDLKSWVGYRNGFKYPAFSVTKPFSFTRANLIWLEPFLRFSPSLVGHFQMHTLKPSCDHNFTSRPDLVWSSSSASNSDDFPFLWILYCSSRTRVTAVWRSVDICWNFSHRGSVWLPAPVWAKFQQILNNLQTAVTRVLDEQ